MSIRFSWSLLAVAALAAPAIGSAQSATPPPPSGIFLEGPGGAMTPVPGTMSQDTQTHGVAKSIVTQGFSKPTMSVRHPGASAELVIMDASPAFFFRFYDQALAMKMAQENPMAYLGAMQGAGGGMPLMGKDAKEYTLAKLVVDGDARVASSKGMETFKLVVQKKNALEFEVHVVAPLEPGEYAFFWSAGGAAPNQIWAFSLKGSN
jgi:hypothetical protein